MNPPLRDESDRGALIAALADGTLDCVATDHAPHDADEKEVPFEEAPFGVTGLETAFAACHTHLVRTGRARPRAAGAAHERRTRRRPSGCRCPRSPRARSADLALIDLEAVVHVGEAGFQSKSRNSAFLGDDLYGRVMLTIAGGQIAWRV